MIDDLVIIFADITAAKTLEGKLRATQASLEKHIAGQDVKPRQAGGIVADGSRTHTSEQRPSD
jgi:hypothetical protein